MRVLQVIATLEAGGAEGFIANLCVSVRRHGVDVRLFLLAGARGSRGEALLTRLREAEVEVIGAEPRNIRSPVNLIRLARVINEWRPDVVQGNMFQAEVMISMAKFLVLTCSPKYVRRLANVDIAEGRPVALVRLMDRIFNLTIACSMSVRSSYIEFMRSPLRSRVVTIANGGLLQSHSTEAQARLVARSKFAIPEDSFVVVHIGRMAGGSAGNNMCCGQKAHDIVIASFAKAFASEDSNSLLLLVGDGPLRDEAEELVQKLGIGHKVLFVGVQAEPWDALRSADLFFFPSRYEGSPNVLPEAASCGLPILASNIDEIRDLGLGGACVLRSVNDVAAFSAALKDMRRNIQHYNSIMCMDALHIRDRFSMERCSRSYIDIYEEILSIV